MQSPDLQRLEHIREYCEEIGKTAKEDIPALLAFCEKMLAGTADE